MNIVLNTNTDGLDDGAEWVKNGSQEVEVMGANRKLLNSKIPKRKYIAFYCLTFTDIKNKNL
jgi:hypothetical protein